MVDIRCLRADARLSDLVVDERTNESCIVYLNGEYCVYEYREKVDDLDFTTEYYDQPRHFVDFIKTWAVRGQSTETMPIGCRL